MSPSMTLSRVALAALEVMVVSSGPAAFEMLYIDRLAGLPFVQTLTSQLAMKVVKRSQILPVHY